MTLSRKNESLPRIQAPVSASLWQAIQHHCESTGESLEHLVQAALADYLQVEHATLFQVSTAGALVEGIYRGEVNVHALREHGDFGIGTFNGLDGELIAVDGRFYQVRANGTVREVTEKARTPYAMILKFPDGPTETLGDCLNLPGLHKQLDQLRDSNNVFFAIRVDGEFSTLVTRSVHPTHEGTRLAEATQDQSEFILHDVRGTLVGFWSPRFLQNVLVAGYHLHFISEDRQSGGHVLACSCGHGLQARVRRVADFRLSFPESNKYLHADLSRDPKADLDRAEGKQRS